MYIINRKYVTSASESVLALVPCHITAKMARLKFQESSTSGTEGNEEVQSEEKEGGRGEEKRRSRRERRKRRFE